jgi:hypothetical protein
MPDLIPIAVVFVAIAVLLYVVIDVLLDDYAD